MLQARQGPDVLAQRCGARVAQVIVAARIPLSPSPSLPRSLPLSPSLSISLMTLRRFKRLWSVFSSLKSRVSLLQLFRLCVSVSPRLSSPRSLAKSLCISH